MASILAGATGTTLKGKALVKLYTQFHSSWLPLRGLNS